MAQQSDSADTPRWSLTPAEVRQLDRKFRSSLLSILHELETRNEQDDLPDEVAMAQLADVLSAAGTSLDEYAANCHALAATLQTYATGAEFLPGEAMPDARLSGAIGKRVVLTRTTIEELRGKTLTLERLSENNAIIRHEEDYWGTPVDRILVIDGAAAPSEDDGGPETEEEADGPPLSVSPKAKALIERIQAGELTSPVVLWSCGHADIVRLEYPPEGLREFLPLTALPDRLSAFLADARRRARRTELRLDGADAPQPASAAAFLFRLRRGELGNAIQFLTMAGREGRLDVRTPAENDVQGTIHLQHGVVVRVTYLDHTGVEALARMLVQDELNAEFEDGPASAEPEMSMATDQLLIEAAVRADEIADRERDAGPDQSAAIQ